MYAPQTPRTASAVLAIALTAGLVAVLFFGFAASRPMASVPAMISIALTEPPPPPPKQKPKPEVRDARKAAPKDDAGRRNLRNQATAVVAPPVVPLVVPPPIIAAPIANLGSGAQTGASDLPGPGQGAGRFGDGFGGGGTGGNGDGDGGGPAVQGPRRKSGRIAFEDLPEDALALGEEAPVMVVYAVERDGTVTGCRAERSSGRSAIDSLTCRLIEQRFRYRPALDRNGRPVRSMVRETHTWVANDR